MREGGSDESEIVGYACDLWFDWGRAGVELVVLSQEERVLNFMFVVCASVFLDFFILFTFLELWAKNWVRSTSVGTCVVEVDKVLQ